MRSTRRLAAALATALLMAGGPATGAVLVSKGSKKKVRPTPTPTRTVAPLQGPPPPPLLKAAGSCMRYEPGHYLVLAEVDHTGRVYRIDPETAVLSPVKVGARVRILYVDGPDGPIARKILPGPLPVGPGE